MGLGLQPLSTSQNTQIRIAGSVQREAKTTGRKLKFLTFKWPEIRGSLQIDKSDFAIFVFNPDDISIIRNETNLTTRDNVVFELGLFIGKIGPKRVFFVTPEDETIHLPTDLLGINPGKYNSKRSDGNLLAALGPFCNQIRSELKQFKYTNLKDLDGETDNAKKIAIEKPFGYEYLLLAELIETRLDLTNSMFSKLNNGVYFVRSSKIDDSSYMSFFQETLEDFLRFTSILGQIINEELPKALGLPGVPANFSELKKVSDQLYNLSIELFNWESRNEQIIPPLKLEEVKTLLKGSSNVIYSQITKLPSEIRRVVQANQNPSASPDELKINLVIDMPDQMNLAVKVFKDYYGV